jgi:predicted RNA binding protein YcfA (HicA-like mRNA interferase family)
MSAAPRITADDVIRALRKLRFVKVSQRGSHQKWKQPDTGKIVIVPYHSKQIIHPKTFATIVEGTGLTMDRFREYL